MFSIDLIVDICTQAAGWGTWWAQWKCPKDWWCRANHTRRAVWTGNCYWQGAKLVDLCSSFNSNTCGCFTGKDPKRPKLGDGDYFQQTWFRAGLLFHHLQWEFLFVFQFAYPFVPLPQEFVHVKTCVAIFFLYPNNSVAKQNPKMSCPILWCRKEWPWWWRRLASRVRSCWSRSWLFYSSFFSFWCSWHSQVHQGPQFSLPFVVPPYCNLWWNINRRTGVTDPL